MDAVAGVRYILELKPETKVILELIKITHLDMIHGRLDCCYESLIAKCKN